MLKYTAEELEHMIREGIIIGEFLDVTDNQGYSEEWKFIVDDCPYYVEYELLDVNSFEKQIGLGIVHQAAQEEKKDMDKNIKLQEIFSQHQLQLLYAACLCYGNSLTTVNKDIYGCSAAIKIIEARAKEAYEMGVRLTEGMEE